MTRSLPLREGFSDGGPLLDGAGAPSAARRRDPCARGSRCGRVQAATPAGPDHVPRAGNAARLRRRRWDLLRQRVARADDRHPRADRDPLRGWPHERLAGDPSRRALRFPAEHGGRARHGCDHRGCGVLPLRPFTRRGTAGGSSRRLDGRRGRLCDAAQHVLAAPRVGHCCARSPAATTRWRSP